jgi:hypothetical protein
MYVWGGRKSQPRQGILGEARRALCTVASIRGVEVVELAAEMPKRTEYKSTPVEKFENESECRPYMSLQIISSEIPRLCLMDLATSTLGINMRKC